MCNDKIRLKKRKKGTKRLEKIRQYETRGEKEIRIGEKIRQEERKKGGNETR